MQGRLTGSGMSSHDPISKRSQRLGACDNIDTIALGLGCGVAPRGITWEFAIVGVSLYGSRVQGCRVYGLCWLPNPSNNKCLLIPCHESFCCWSMWDPESSGHTVSVVGFWT